MSGTHLKSCLKDPRVTPQSGGAGEELGAHRPRASLLWAEVVWVALRGPDSRTQGRPHFSPRLPSTLHPPTTPLPRSCSPRPPQSPLCRVLPLFSCPGPPAACLRGASPACPPHCRRGRPGPRPAGVLRPWANDPVTLGQRSVRAAGRPRLSGSIPYVPWQRRPNRGAPAFDTGAAQ